MEFSSNHTGKVQSTTPPILTIIIPTFNRSDQVESTLLSILQSVIKVEIKTTRVKVILVDNNSSTEHQNRYLASVKYFASQMDVDYLFEAQQGRSMACNTGVRHAESAWVAFVDDDETLLPGWLEVALDLIRSEKYHYFGGHVLPDWEIPAPPWLPIHKKKYLGVLGWIELTDDNQ